MSFARIFILFSFLFSISFAWQTENSLESGENEKDNLVDVDREFTSAELKINRLESRFEFPEEDEENDVEIEKYRNMEMYQGDIIPSESKSSLFTRTGILDQERRWPKNEQGKVIVPYKISEVFSEL